MSTVTSPEQLRAPKGLQVVLWVIQIALALVFFTAGGSKLAAAPSMVRLFDVIGSGQWFRYVTGCVEIVGAVLLLVPWMSAAGAVLLAAVMIGAIETQLFILHASPVIPLVLLAALAFIVWGHRAQLAGVVRPRRTWR